MYLARKELAEVLFSISLKNGELQRYEPTAKGIPKGDSSEDLQRKAGIASKKKSLNYYL